MPTELCLFSYGPSPGAKCRIPPTDAASASTCVTGSARFLKAVALLSCPYRGLSKWGGYRWCSKRGLQSLRSLVSRRDFCSFLLEARAVLLDAWHFSFYSRFERLRPSTIHFHDYSWEPRARVCLNLGRLKWINQKSNLLWMYLPALLENFPS
jgi:hypothetical protein